MAKVVGKMDGKDVLGYDFQDIKIKTDGDLKDDEILMIGSTETVDRDQDIIKMDGWQLERFQKNPVILPAHNYYMPAIGKALKVTKNDGKLSFKIKFPPEGTFELADVYRRLYKGGFMHASSVGFYPYEWDNGEKGDDFWHKYTKQELLELSLVSVPSNPDALLSGKGLQSAKKSGAISAQQFDRLAKIFKEVAADTAKNVFTGSAIPSEGDKAEFEVDGYKLASFFQNKEDDDDDNEEKSSDNEKTGATVQKPEPEVTEDTIRIRVRDPERFDEDSFRTITLSEEEGIQAVIGKYADSDDTDTHVQQVIFEKDNWTVADAEKWVEDHEDTLKMVISACRAFERAETKENPEEKPQQQNIEDLDEKIQGMITDKIFELIDHGVIPVTSTGKTHYAEVLFGDTGDDDPDNGETLDEKAVRNVFTQLRGC